MPLVTNLLPDPKGMLVPFGVYSSRDNIVHMILKFYSIDLIQ